MDKNKRQKILLYSLPLSILGIGAITAPAILLFKKSDKENEIYYFNSKAYKTYYEWEKAIREVARQVELFDEKTVYYSNNQNKSFSNINNFKKFLANHIHTIDGTYYGDIDKNDLNVNGSLSSNLIDQFNFDEPKIKNGKKADDNTTAYMGKNGLAYESEDEAKNSYANISAFYKFQGRYYASKQEIKNIIHREILRINAEFADSDERAKAFKNFFSIKQPENVYQAPTNVIFTTGEIDNALEEIKLDEFIESNCKKYIKYDGKIIEFEEFKDYLFSSHKSLAKLPILYVQSNQGRKKYLVDIHKDDPCNLYGNYVHETTGREIENITNTKNWAKQPTNDFKQKIHTSQYHSLIKKFTSNLLATSNASYINKYIKENNLDKSESKELVEKYVNNFSIFTYFKFKDKFEIMQKELKKVEISKTSKIKIYITS